MLILKGDICDKMKQNHINVGVKFLWSLTMDLFPLLSLSLSFCLSLEPNVPATKVSKMEKVEVRGT